MSQRFIPKITLVGAGPGDPDLLTIKGARAIRSADVLLYDALIGPGLLELARPEALLIYVGKRAGRHRRRQEEINQQMVAYARSHGHVVRLKGGDPFVFGRGQEEVAYARELGIPVEVIPGISSCIAVPELQHVPPTRRGYSESFWVVAGTTRSGGLSKDLALAARSTATVIVLMGMRKARAIAALFERQGKGHLPAMAIQNGALPDERRVLGTAAEIADKIEAEGLGTPGILVFGEVVALHPDWDFAEIAADRIAGRRA
ncbi:MAG: uroporphyrinogen-III C-methyltransferase [Phaeodactylibacter sp.]|nr:uroporphyrinogen-III C-methyltransferase [Phaeodactylibacter sp.]